MTRRQYYSLLSPRTRRGVSLIPTFRVAFPFPYRTAAPA